MSDSDKSLPVGIQLTSLDEQFREDPYPILRKVQEQTRFHEDPELGRYIFTHHYDVKEILRDKHYWSDPRKAREGSFAREVLGATIPEGGEPSMLLMDEPDHRRLRSLVSSPFTPSAVERWRPRTREVVQRMLDAITTQEFDLISQFAAPIPTVVIAELLGIDAGKHEAFKHWSDRMVQVSFNPFPDEEQAAIAMEARDNLEQFFEEEIHRRSNSLGDDLLSAMIRAEEDGEKLSHQEIISQCNLLLIAGNVTTTDLIGNGMKALLDHPEQMQKLREDPSLIANAVEEMLRYDSPVTNSGRIAHESRNVAGCPAHQGDNLAVSLAAANRDPAVYPQPNRFDIEREDTHHQAFCGGRHLCLGAHLARLEAQEAILGLLQRYPELEISERGYHYHAIPTFRGMSELWVTTRPA